MRIPTYNKFIILRNLKNSFFHQKSRHAFCCYLTPFLHSNLELTPVQFYVFNRTATKNPRVPLEREERYLVHCGATFFVLSPNFLKIKKKCPKIGPKKSLTSATFFQILNNR